jgi:extracellular factor (EF) 3-hydroxypalmitic acid methyl ester biosynthesis protein
MVTREYGNMPAYRPDAPRDLLAPHAAKVAFDPIPAMLRPLRAPLSRDPAALFDMVHERLLAGLDPAGTVDRLSDSLFWIRSDVSPGRWQSVCETARLHPLMGLLQESPFLRRAFAKPRGYAGDPVLTDMVLDGVAGPTEPHVSRIGHSLFERDLNTPFAMAIRERRSYFASLIDHVADTVAEPTVLAAGCGHLREAELSSAVREERLGLLLALDPDSSALAQVQETWGGKRVETLARGVTAALDRTLEPSSFDLIYVAGVYEYLLDRFAQGLTRGFFDLLRPDGRLVISSPVPGLYDRAYLECFADWPMTLRDAPEVADLHRAVAPADIGLARVYTRRSPDMMYLELRRRGAGVG